MNIKELNQKMPKPLYCILESFLYTTLIYIVFFSLSPFKYHFLEMNLHPLLIVIAVISVKYGTHLSTFGVIFSMFYYFVAYLQLGRDPIIFFGSFDYYKFILMFFFTALFIGKIRDNMDEKLVHMKNEREDFKTRLHSQKRNNIKLAYINSRLKNQITTSRESLLTLNKLTTSLEGMGKEEILTETLLNIKQFLDCDVISFYTYDKNRKFSRLKLKLGPSRMPTNFVVEGECPYLEVIDKKEPLNFSENNDAIAVYVAPIMDGSSVIGFINIERVNFSSREKYTFEMFKVISYWLNKTLAKTLGEHEKEVLENTYKNTRIFNIDYFNERLIEEKRRNKLFKMEFLAFEGKIGNLDVEALNKKIEGNIRMEDVVGANDQVVRFLFPATDTNSKELIYKKLEDMFGETDFYEI